jgi:hypothetical protein
LKRLRQRHPRPGGDPAAKAKLSPEGEVLRSSSASKLGSRSETPFNTSSCSTCRARGVRTLRPTSCAIYVASFARRNDIITSARGQSHPVFRLVLKSTIFRKRSASIADGARYPIAVLSASSTGRPLLECVSQFSDVQTACVPQDRDHLIKIGRAGLPLSTVLDLNEEKSDARLVSRAG